MRLFPAAGLLCTFAIAARGQKCAPQPHPFFEFQVEQPARFVSADSGRPQPVADPEAAHRAHTDTLVVQFAVDTTGRAAPASLKFLRGGGRADWQAIRDALPTWRFEPAESPKGCRVVELMQTPIMR